MASTKRSLSPNTDIPQGIEIKKRKELISSIENTFHCVLDLFQSREREKEVQFNQWLERQGPGAQPTIYKFNL